MATVLIADDETNLRKVLCALLQRDAHRAMAVADGQEALSCIKGGGIDILITDLKMPKMNGMQLLAEVRQLDPGLPVIVITAHGTIDTAVSALKMGAFDYITKPFERDELTLIVRKAAAVRQGAKGRLHDGGDARGRFKIIGQSQHMAHIYTIIEKVAPTPSTVLILGESGTGKELVAAALHENSSRHALPFIKVNCGAIPKDLMESEFFGHERGAFSGAVQQKPGRFELADGGTLFLDEIAELTVDMQAKLLRALQDGGFERVGGVRTLNVDVRVVAATHRDLAHAVAQGTFREDLYYRLNVVEITLPALRERPEDIPLLVAHFVERLCRRLHKKIDGLSANAMNALKAYSFPGNIRELENIIERCLLLCEGAVIDVADLPEAVRLKAPPPQAQPLAANTPLHDATAVHSMRAIVRQATSHLERDLIAKALETTHGNVTHAAVLLQISRKGLQNKMKELALRPPDAESETEL